MDHASKEYGTRSNAGKNQSGGDFKSGSDEHHGGFHAHQQTAGYGKTEEDFEDFDAKTKDSHNAGHETTHGEHKK